MFRGASWMYKLKRGNDKTEHWGNPTVNNSVQAYLVIKNSDDLSTT